MKFFYDEENVFFNFSLKIAGSKKTAFVGVSGSGKTTLMKLIAEYLSPDAGSLLFDGQDSIEV